MIVTLLTFKRAFSSCAVEKCGSFIPISVADSGLDVFLMHLSVLNTYLVAANEKNAFVNFKEIVFPVWHTS